MIYRGFVSKNLELSFQLKKERLRKVSIGHHFLYSYLSI